jgi:hypothetical protein
MHSLTYLVLLLLIPRLAVVTPILDVVPLRIFFLALLNQALLNITSAQKEEVVCSSICHQ